MSQFEKHTIQENIRQCEEKIRKLESTQHKISKNDQQLRIQSSLESVNSCAMFIVDIKHTSEYMIKLGNKQTNAAYTFADSQPKQQYFAKTKTATTLKIIQHRITQHKKMLEKWGKLKKDIEAKDKQKKSRNQQSQHSWATKDVIGENEDGQQIFNIVQFCDKPKSSELTTIPEQSINSSIVPEQQKQDSKSQAVSSKKKAQTSKSHQIAIQIVTDEKPKKISKFKQDRLNMKKL